jgi:hypothetical protein
MQYPTDDSVLRSGGVLLGFMSEEEAAAFVGSQTAASWDELRPLWQDARAAYEDLPVFEPQAPKIEDLPQEISEEIEAIRSAPAFQQHLQARMSVSRWWICSISLRSSSLLIRSFQLRPLDASSMNRMIYSAK